MSITSINEKNLISSYLAHAHRNTSKAIKQQIGELNQSEITYETALELGSIYMYHFGKTNIDDFNAFVQSKQIEFSNNKIAAYFNVFLNRKVDLNIDFETLTSNTIANYDVAQKHAAKFLEEIGIPSPFINTFIKNSEQMKELGKTLALDYFHHQNKTPSQDEFKNKHIYTIFKNLGDDYKNMEIGFSDNHNWKYDNNMMMFPKKGFIQHGGIQVDVVNNFGGGYELDTLMRDKQFFAEIVKEWFAGYTPDNANHELKELHKQNKELDSFQNAQETKKLDERMSRYFKSIKP